MVLPTRFPRNTCRLHANKVSRLITKASLRRGFFLVAWVCFQKFANNTFMLPSHPGFLLLALLATVGIYWPGLAGGFVFDDHASIVNNAALRLFDGTWPGLVDALQGDISGPSGRPLSMATFALNLFFLGDAPRYFKWVNLTIHLLNGLLVYQLCRQLWPRLIGDGRAALAAYWITALWLLHPINLTPVLFVVQRMTSLAALFTLAALCLYVFGRQRAGLVRWLAFAAAFLICWPAGVLAKETALLLPLFVLLCEWLVFRSLAALPQRVLTYGLAAAAIGLAALLMAAWPLIQQSYLLRDFTLAERLLTEARVLWMYVIQMLLPWPDLFSLHHDDIAISRGIFDPPLTALAVLAWAATIAIALMQHRRRPWLTFAVLWFLAGHALESTLLGLEIAYEHRNYLPSIGIFIGLAALLLPAGMSSGKLPRMALACCFVAYCGLVTNLRAAQWGDEYIRTQIESNTHPQSARTHYEAARAILARSRQSGEMNVQAYQMARIHFQRAGLYDPQSKAAPAGLLYLDCAVGMKRDEEALQTLLDRLGNQRFSLGEQGFVQGLSDMLVDNLLCLDGHAVEKLIAAALANPSAKGKIRGMLHAVAMDYAAARLGSLPRARMHAMAAVESDPGNAVLRINLIRVLLYLGDTVDAKRQYAVLKGLKIPAVNRKEVENLGLGLAQ